MADIFEVFDSNLNGLGAVDLYDELVWERRYYEAGYAEMHAPATNHNSELLKIGNILYKNGGTEALIITALRENKSDEVESKVAYGRFLSYLLHKHIIRSDFYYGGPVEELMRTLVCETVMNEENDDYIPFVKLGKKSRVTKEYRGYVEYGDLHDTLKKIATETGVSFRIRFDPSEKAAYFECYEGKDRSVMQTENPQVVFSEIYDNILSSAELMTDTTEEITAATARYKGPYGEVSATYNPSGKRGINKKELYIEGDAVTYVDSQGITRLDKAETKKRLMQHAKEAIKAASYDFTCSAGYAAGYKSDYDLGDIVTIYKPDWGVTVHLRIDKITENTTAAGHEVIPVFGTPHPLTEQEA